MEKGWLCAVNEGATARATAEYDPFVGNTGLLNPFPIFVPCFPRSVEQSIIIHGLAKGTGGWKGTFGLLLLRCTGSMANRDDGGASRGATGNGGRDGGL